MNFWRFCINLLDLPNWRACTIRHWKNYSGEKGLKIVKITQNKTVNTKNSWKKINFQEMFFEFENLEKWFFQNWWTRLQLLFEKVILVISHQERTFKLPSIFSTNCLKQWTDFCWGSHQDKTTNIHSPQDQTLLLLLLLHWVFDDFADWRIKRIKEWRRGLIDWLLVPQHQHNLTEIVSLLFLFVDHYTPTQETRTNHGTYLRVKNRNRIALTYETKFKRLSFWWMK